MLIQLGTKQFNGIYAPGAWSYSGNEANLAQYDLINTKPRLQFTGETLEEVALTFHLRAEFCNPANEIKDLEAWKSAGEVLPLLLGTGEYKGDYVISSVGKTIRSTFSDGTIIDAEITLNLLETVPSDPAAQQAATDRRNAAAVGDKKQIVRLPAQGLTSEADAHKALMQAELKSLEVNDEAQKGIDSGNPETRIDKIKAKVARAQASMDEARQKVSDMQQQINNATGIIAAIDNAKDNLTEIGSLMQPPISTQALNDSILNLQTGLRSIDSNSTIFTQQVILRQV